MNELLRKQLGNITEDEFNAAMWAGDNYFESCKNTGDCVIIDDLITVMANNIKRYRGIS